MPRIARVDERLLAVDMPALAEVSDLAIGSEDVLLLCAGFEDRAVAAISRAIESGSGGFGVLAIGYLPVLAANRLEDLRAQCRVGGARWATATYNRQNPEGAGAEIMAALAGSTGRIVLDVSGMSRLLIVQMVVALSEVEWGLERTLLVYAEAEEYPPTEVEVDQALGQMKSRALCQEMFLSSGVFGITVLPELASASLEGQPIRLVAFPSFNVHQLAALRIELQPSHYTVIHGKPHLEKNTWRLEKIRRLNRTDSVPSREDCVASTFDYRETLRALLRVYGEHGATQRIVISPTGSKMQALAVGLFRSVVTDAQVVYPTPRTFAAPERYTKGVHALWGLPLAAFAGLAFRGE